MPAIEALNVGSLLMEIPMLDCGDEWSWDRRDRSSEVELTDSLLRVAHFHPNWSSGTAAVRGTRVLNNGRFYWEIKLSHRIFGTSMMFGVGTKQARLQAETFTNLIGEDENGWALSHRGLVWHAGRWFHYTKPFVENQPAVIGILFDGIFGTISYFKDGVSLGVAFRGLHKIREPLHPMISSTAAKTQMTLCKMRRNFVNLQDRCRAEIVKRICDKNDVENLLLPSQMKRYIIEAVMESSQRYIPDHNYALMNF